MKMAAEIVRHWKLATFWVLSLIVVSAISSSAQFPGRGGLPGLPPSLILENPVVLTGSEVGFRLERVRDGVPIGTVVVRVDGRWVAPQTR
jgi:hypothetical protein